MRRKLLSANGINPRRDPYVAVLVPLALVGLLGYLVWVNRAELRPLSDASIPTVTGIASLVAGAHFVNSTEFWLLYRTQRAGGGLFENWMLFFAGNLSNYLPGQPGTLYRLGYMRTVHAVPLAVSGAVYGANLIATLAGAALAGLLGVLALGIEDHWAWTMLLVYFALGAIAGAAAIAPLPRAAAGGGKLAKAWRAFSNGFEQIRSNPGVAVLVCGLEALKYTMTALRFALSFALIGVHESYWLFLALAPAAGIAQFFSFTPGAIGIREAALSAATLALGASFSAGLLAATIDRAVMLATSVVFGSVGYAVTYPRLQRARAAPATASNR